MTEVMEANKALITIDEANALKIFTERDAIEPILQIVRGKIDAFVPDIMTTKGRKEIKSMAANVARSKTYLDDIGKALNDVQKEIPKKIDATRKHIRDTLDAWKEEVRKPLTEWEDAEEARIKKHGDAIAAIVSNSAPPEAENLLTLRALLRVVEDVIVSPECEEFEDEYCRAKEAGISKLKALIIAREQYERDQAELATLRAEREAREAKEREEQLAREAQEARERQERDTQARIAAEAERSAQTERDRAARELAEAEARALTAQRESERREAEFKARTEAAEQQARDTEARIKREAEAAAKAEAAELARREADKAHKAKINREAVKAFVAGGLSEEIAKVAVTLIAKKAIPAVAISY